MNKLNVFNNDYCPWRYPSNWIKNIRLFGRQFKWAYQRITKGFCDPDWWDMDTHLKMLIADMLEEMIKRSISYPGTDEFDTPEKWNDYLKTIVAKLRYSLKDLDNEYDNEYIAILEKEDIISFKNRTPEEKEITKKYLDKEIDNWKLQEKAQNEALEMLVHCFNQLWD